MLTRSYIHFFHSKTCIDLIMVFSEFSTNLKIPVLIILCYSLTISFSITKTGENINGLRKMMGGGVIIISRVCLLRYDLAS